MSIPSHNPSKPTPGFKAWWQSQKSSFFSSQTSQVRRRRYAQILIEWLIILVVGWLYAGNVLLELNPSYLQQTGEYNQSATFPILTDIGLNRYGELPLWNPYTLTGFPYVEDPLNHLWHPISTIPIKIWGGINGMKVSMVLAFIIAGLGQWLFAHTFGLRGLSRLWTALFFMLSGGLAFLSDLGWYELLLGAVWFPWCFAAVWWAMRRRDWTSMILAAFCITMVLTTGGGYYPFYLFVSLSVVVVVHLLWSANSKRWVRLLRAICIAIISAGLLAVVFLPILHGFPLINRWTGDDREQTYSQPIPYALMHFVISDPNWPGAEILGLPSGWKWFYIGAIALGSALCLAPLAFVLQRSRRVLILTLAILTMVILFWMANRFTPPIAYIYELIPFLYTLRFPNRLLIIATSPLLAVGAWGWQSLYREANQWRRKDASDWTLVSQTKAHVIKLISPRWVMHLILLSVMTYSVIDVFIINKTFAFGTGELDPALKNTLTWLKVYDPSLYYINLGGGDVHWPGTPVAYELELPVINFDYGRHLVSNDLQFAPESPFIATPKYVVMLPDTPMTLAENAQPINTIDGYTIWYLPDALPVAFSAPATEWQNGNHITRGVAAPLDVKYDGPNRVVVHGAQARPGDQLVVLISDYPGWELSVDGNPAPLVPVNGYLGAAMLSGNHTYTFNFRPAAYFLGLAISGLTLLAALGLMLKEAVRPKIKPVQA